MKRFTGSTRSPRSCFPTALENLARPSKRSCSRSRTIGASIITARPTSCASQRHFSYSDRIRYYWPAPDAQRETQTLLEVLGDREISRTLVGQYLGQLDAAVAAGRVKPSAHELLIGSITRILDISAGATRRSGSYRPFQLPN